MMPLPQIYEGGFVVSSRSVYDFIMEDTELICIPPRQVDPHL